MNTPLSRRTALQAAGATALAAALTNVGTHGNTDSPEVLENLTFTDYIPMHANEHVTNLRFITTAEAAAS